MEVVRLKKSVVEEVVVDNRLYKIKIIDEPFYGDFDYYKKLLASCEEASINNFRPEGSDHKPKTTAKLVSCKNGLLGKFKVKDRYIVAKHIRYNSMVCEDSCVEIFIKPKDSKGYINFEFNCLGTIHSSYITDHRRTENGFKKWEKIPKKLGSEIITETTFNAPIETEIRDSLNWEVLFFIPFSLIEEYVGKLNFNSWRGNFYKCADKCSHPHWGAWNPVSKLNFHEPLDFGEFNFHH